MVYMHTSDKNINIFKRNNFFLEFSQNVGKQEKTTQEILKQ